MGPDLTDHRWMYAKTLGLGLIALLSAGLLLAERFDLRTAFLLALLAWSCARFYYFCFYVIEHYIDPGYRFAGIISAISHLARRRTGSPPLSQSDD